MNITQQERAALGTQANDTLGQVLEALKNETDNDISDVKSTIATIQSALNQKGNCRIQTGSYVGNGQTIQMSITFDFSPDLILIYGNKLSAFPVNGQSFYTSLKNITWAPNIISEETYYESNGRTTLRQYNLSGNVFTWKIGGSDSFVASTLLNENGVEYRWVAFKCIV